ncbi:MAG: NAD-dependent epimerase/dehydratase family protein [Candidatus Nanohaloarchaea archaeon]
MKVAITGVTGTVGTATAEKLKRRGHSIVGLGRSFDDRHHENLDRCVEADLTTEEGRGSARKAFDDVDAVFHLAWNIPVENFDTDEKWEGNMVMYENVVQAAAEADVKIFINGSSIHAGTGDIPAYTAEASLEETPEPYRSSIDPDSDYRLKEEKPEELLSPMRNEPDSPYGESKIETEQMLREAVDNDRFPVGVSLRIGGINSEDEPRMEGEPYFGSLYLSHRTICRILEAIISSENRGYHQLYAVSDNPGRIFSLQNDIGWDPEPRER